MLVHSIWMKTHRTTAVVKGHSAFVIRSRVVEVLRLRADYGLPYAVVKAYLHRPRAYLNQQKCLSQLTLGLPVPGPEL